MSTPMYDTPEHFPMPIHAGGEGPRALVVRTICWSCLPEEDWPCEAYRLESQWLSPEWGVEYRRPDSREGDPMTLDDLWHPPRPGPSYWDYRCLVCGAPVDDHPSFWRRLKRWIRRRS